MAAETIENQLPPQPLFDINQPGASFDLINKLVLPIQGRLLRGVNYGEFSSRRIGQGSDYDGVRDFASGDSPRDVDWKQTVRTAPDPSNITRLKVRERYQDITPNVWLVTDALERQNVSNPGYYSKQKLALSALATMLFIARREGMPTALVACNEHTQVQSANKPKTGINNTLHIARELTSLAESADSKRTELDKARLASILPVTARLATRNVVVIVSDFLDVVDPSSPNGGWLPAVCQMRAKGNEVLGIQIKSPWDTELPKNVDRFHSEGSVQRIGSGKKAELVRGNYRVITKSQQKAIKGSLVGSGAAHVRLDTEDPRWFSSLYKQLATSGKNVQNKHK